MVIKKQIESLPSGLPEGIEGEKSFIGTGLESAASKITESLDDKKDTWERYLNYDLPGGDTKLESGKWLFDEFNKLGFYDTNFDFFAKIKNNIGFESWDKFMNWLMEKDQNGLMRRKDLFLKVFNVPSGKKVEVNQLKNIVELATIFGYKTSRSGEGKAFTEALDPKGALRGAAEQFVSGVILPYYDKYGVTYNLEDINKAIEANPNIENDTYLTSDCGQFIDGFDKAITGK